ncbi:MAG: hypothetical protein KJO69_01910 [Gammaproteobacteria bacterium]|nr:hypothetical protein [Gammaproteobacteria bacterium]
MGSRDGGWVPDGDATLSLIIVTLGGLVLAISIVMGSLWIAKTFEQYPILTYVIGISWTFIAFFGGAELIKYLMEI